MSLAVGLLGGAFALVPWAHLSSDTSFDRPVGWSNILAFLVGLVALLIQVATVVLDRYGIVSSAKLAEAADFIAASVHHVEGGELLRLAGTDRPEARRINLRFRRVFTSYQTAGGAPTGSLEEVLGYYRSLQPGRMVILGDPGSGKTVLATYLLVELLEQRLSSNSPGDPVPVKFSLSGFDPAQSLDAWICEQLTARFPALGRRVVTELVSRRQILPILDGLDEVEREPETAGRQARVVEAVNAYFDGSRAGRLVVTCRSSAYSDQIAAIDIATSIMLEPLEAGEIAAYLTGHMRQRGDELAWFDVLAPLRSDPTGEAACGIVRQLATPWVLTLAIAAYRGGGDPVEVLLRQSAQSGDAAQDLLLEQFVRSAVVLHPRGGTQYEERQVLGWLAAVAAYLREQAARGGSGVDLVLHQSWSIAGERRVRRLHATLAAVGVAAAIVSTLASIPDPRAFSGPQLLRYLHTVGHLETTFVGAALVVVVGTFGLPLLAARHVSRAQVEPSRMGWSHLFTSKGRRGLVIGAGAGLVMGSGFGLVIGLTEGLPIGVGAGVLGGAASGFIAGLAFGLASGTDWGSAKQPRPREVVRGDLQHWATHGFMVGLVGAAAGTVAVGVPYGAAVGIAAWVVHGLLIGPIAAVRYYLAVAICAGQGQLPARFGAFLDWAVSAGLLRTSGIAYQFRHGELQSWLDREAAGV
ncbi:NACHT domain-containing protein [Micromonospora chersina]